MLALYGGLKLELVCKNYEFFTSISINFCATHNFAVKFASDYR